MAFDRHVFACEFGVLVDVEFPHIRMNEDAAALARNVSTDDITLLEHVNPSS